MGKARRRGGDPCDGRSAFASFCRINTEYLTGCFLPVSGRCSSSSSEPWTVSSLDVVAKPLPNLPPCRSIHFHRKRLGDTASLHLHFSCCFLPVDVREKAPYLQLLLFPAAFFWAPHRLPPMHFYLYSDPPSRPTSKNHGVVGCGLKVLHYPAHQLLRGPLFWLLFIAGPQEECALIKSIPKAQRR
jgi:hypothetical protein